MDAGQHRALFDAKGQQTKHWHEDTEERRVYDLAGRLTARHVTDSGTSWQAEAITYGEGATGAADRNQLGRAILVQDGAGEQSTPRYGAFGEPLETTRTLTATAGLEPDWSGTVALEPSGYTSVSAFDPLGRRTRALLPDGTERQEDYLRMGPVAALRVITPDSVTRTIVTDAEYNARGQQVSSTLGNGVDVTSVYDTDTFRLYQRQAALAGTGTYQDLRHHYDPVGNLVYVDDRAQSPTSTMVINGLTVGAKRVFGYDARYQLTQATGRVHNALTQPDFRGDVPTSGSFRGTRRVGLNDGGAVSRYKRTYTYDDAGNLQGWSHGPEVGGGAGNSWTNDKWVSSTSNRSFPAYDLNGIAVTDPGSNFNARGQLASLPSVRSMEWSVRDLLRKTVLIQRTGADDDDEVYDYAADGTRLRKTLHRVYDVTNNLVETTETITLDGCELRRITQDTSVILERWSSNVADGDQRVATVYRWDSDTLARETDDITSVRTHYHLGTHLGSVALELGGSGELLSYEEYFPYGRTAFLAGDSLRQIQYRTLRYVGKDQDDATGFYVFQYRYYAPFLGNWVSPDPAGEVDGTNRYWYVRNNPISVMDRHGLQATEQRHQSRRTSAQILQELQPAERRRVESGEADVLITPDGLRVVPRAESADAAAQLQADNPNSQFETHEFDPGEEHRQFAARYAEIVRNALAGHGSGRDQPQDPGTDSPVPRAPTDPSPPRGVDAPSGPASATPGEGEPSPTGDTPSTSPASDQPSTRPNIPGGDPRGHSSDGSPLGTTQSGGGTGGTAGGEANGRPGGRPEEGGRRIRRGALGSRRLH